MFHEVVLVLLALTLIQMVFIVCCHISLLVLIIIGNWNYSCIPTVVLVYDCTCVFCRGLLHVTIHSIHLPLV